MAVISIVGTSGAGKSFLVAQLASLNGMPAFLEGEEGVIPQAVFENVFSGEPTERYRYFVERDGLHLSRARMISDLGLDVYVDGAAMSPEAIMRAEPEEHHETLLPIVRSITDHSSDLTVLLTASPAWLTDAIKRRGRSSEQHDAAIARSLAVQEEFRTLLADASHALIIDRTGIEFTNETDLRAIDARIKAAL